jgi:ferredoxin
MPIVTYRKDGQDRSEEVADNTNLVVRAGIRKFPWPDLRYGCGMGKCGKCTCRVLAGAETLPEPNWKERLVLGEERLAEGQRLTCQLWLHHDLTLTQDGVTPPPPVRANAAAPPPRATGS